MKFFTYSFSPLPAPMTLHPVVSTVLLLAVAVGIAVLTQHLARTLDKGRYRWQQWLRARMGVAPGARIHELRWLAWSLQVVLWPFVAYLLLLVWGQAETGTAVSEALIGEGFELGGSRIVPVKILFGVLWFVLLVTFTRWLKSKLEDDWLPHSHLGASVRVSIATLFGYVTFIIAAVVGLNVAGLDLSNLAVVAGALSVGIGFGLQNIVNNFVSGIILLFERPVRVGDSIKVGGVEGTVRRIRIRSTELDTADLTTIIVPNSELLSSKVENSTYADVLGRVIVPIVLPVSADAERARVLLLTVAHASPRLIQEDLGHGVTRPTVMFQGMSELMLAFEIRGYVADLNTKLGAASDLRFEALKALRGAGIGVLAAPPTSPTGTAAGAASAASPPSTMPPAAKPVAGPATAPGTGP